MAKLIFKDALEEMYGARFAKPKGAMRTAIALNAKNIDVVKQDSDYIVIVAHNDGTSFFKVNETLLVASSNPIIMTDEHTDVFLSCDLMTTTQAKDPSIAFATLSTYKKFSKWLFDLNPDIYTVMTEDMMQFVRSSKFTITLDVEGYNNYMANCILEYTFMKTFLNPCVVELKKGNPLVEQLVQTGKCFKYGTELEAITEDTVGFVYISEKIQLSDEAIADYCCWIEENSDYDHAPLSKYLDIILGFEVK